MRKIKTIFSLRKYCFLSGPILFRMISQLGANPCPKHGERKWLCYIIICSQIQPLHDIEIRIVRCQKDHGDPRRSLFTFLQEIKPTSIRQVDIQEDQVRESHFHLLPRSFQIAAGNCHIFAAFQRLTESVVQPKIILHDHDLFQNISTPSPP